MEIEEKLKPNDQIREDGLSNWSHLPSDLLISVLERVGFADFQRAKCVCSSWHSASKQSSPSDQIPWLILFPEEEEEEEESNKNSYCTLFNPEEKSKVYHMQDLGVEFTKRSVCVATCGCWLLMRDHRYNLFILNLLTKERIDLPPVESLVGRVKIQRTLDDGFLIGNSGQKFKKLSIHSPVLWIDEYTKDYTVLWGLEVECLVHYKKKGGGGGGDDQFNWNQIPGVTSCIHMVYKDHKLYISSRTNIFRILDLSGEVPQEIGQCEMMVFRYKSIFYPACRQYFTILETRVVVTLSGDVLRVNRVLKKPKSRTWLFYVYRVYSSSSGVLLEKPTRVKSLGDEAIVLDLGITVLANDLRGIRRNSIYFPALLDDDTSNPNDVFLYNMETKKKEKIHNFDCSTARLFTARWFLPRLTHAH